MPSKHAWFQRLPEILDVLRNMETSQLDRQGVEQLFGIGERRARQLMVGLSGIRAGNAAAISLTTGAWRFAARHSPTGLSSVRPNSLSSAEN